jgi:hypothetical protein
VYLHGQGKRGQTVPQVVRAQLRIPSQSPSAFENAADIVLAQEAPPPADDQHDGEKMGTFLFAKLLQLFLW